MSYMISVASKPLMLSVVMLSVIMLNVVMLSVIILSVVALEILLRIYGMVYFVP